MKNLYFNKWEFLNALSLIESNPFETKLRFEEYIKNYPNDYSSRIYYSFILIRLGEFETAENIINTTEKLANEDVLFYSDPNNTKIFNKYIINARLKLLSYQEKYNELYQYCLNHLQEIKDSDLNRTFFYSKKKVGMIDFNRREKNSYIFRQIIKYEESDFLEHIKRHLADYNKDSDEPNACIFSSNFPIEDILKEIKKYIPSDKRLYPSDFDNLYTFKYDGCGKVNNKTTDYFKVICFHNTQDIITFYPATDCEELPYIDLNYLNTNKNTKVKRLSQTEKFNQRYKR